jgi:broad specificity phosphatase PhoE
VSKIFLVRHGRVLNPDKLVYGALAGYGLDDVGREEAERAAVALEQAGVSAIYSSPLERAQETAAVIATRLGIAVETLEGLTEAGTSVRWQGTPRRDLVFEHPLELAAWGLAPALISFAEDAPAMAARVEAAIDEAQRLHPGENVALVSHAGPIGAWALSRRQLPYALLVVNRPRNGQGWLLEGDKLLPFRP